MTTDPRLIFLSGIPASDKSTYGKWLERAKGFMHLDVEKNGVLLQAGLKPQWDYIFKDGVSVAPFVDAIRQLRRPVVIDWGFPPKCLPSVHAFHQYGVETWWFDGDREAARQSFIQRGTVSVANLAVQMRSIVEMWPEIKSFFRTRIINTVGFDHLRNVTHTPPEEIFQRMVGSSAV